MFWTRRVTCLFCDRRVPASGAFRGRESRDVTVCLACYERWQRDGRACAGCHFPVHGQQELGVFFKPRPSFGHADCGGTRLVRG
jgi:hypothetical protein